MSCILIQSLRCLSTAGLRLVHPTVLRSSPAILQQATRLYTPFVPPPRKPETPAIKRNRLLYESRKRGNLENGILLSTFADEHLSAMNDEQLATYDYLINQPDNDWDIYYWAIGSQEPPEEYKSEVLDALKKHSRNYGRVFRNQQPSIKTYDK